MVQDDREIVDEDVEDHLLAPIWRPVEVVIEVVRPASRHFRVEGNSPPKCPSYEPRSSISLPNGSVKCQVTVWSSGFASGTQVSTNSLSKAVPSGTGFLAATSRTWIQSQSASKRNRRGAPLGGRARATPADFNLWALVTGPWMEAHRPAVGALRGELWKLHRAAVLEQHLLLPTNDLGRHMPFDRQFWASASAEGITLPPRSRVPGGPRRDLRPSH